MSGIKHFSSVERIPRLFPSKSWSASRVRVRWSNMADVEICLDESQVARNLSCLPWGPLLGLMPSFIYSSTMNLQWVDSCTCILAHKTQAHTHAHKTRSCAFKSRAEQTHNDYFPSSWNLAPSCKFEKWRTWLRRLCCAQHRDVLRSPLLAAHVMRCHEMSWDVMRCYEMSWDVMRCHEMSWDVMRCYEMLWDVMRCHEMLWDVMRCHEMSWDVMRCYEMSWDVMRCHEMSWDVMRCYETEIQTKMQDYFLHIIRK